MTGDGRTSQAMCPIGQRPPIGHRRESAGSSGFPITAFSAEAEPPRARRLPSGLPTLITLCVQVPEPKERRGRDSNPRALAGCPFSSALRRSRYVTVRADAACSVELAPPNIPCTTVWIRLLPHAPARLIDSGTDSGRTQSASIRLSPTSIESCQSRGPGHSFLLRAGTPSLEFLVHRRHARLRCGLATPIGTDQQGGGEDTKLGPRAVAHRLPRTPRRASASGCSD